MLKNEEEVGSDYWNLEDFIHRSNNTDSKIDLKCLICE